ncbi:MAG: hypothetical protein ABJE95_26920 [Byssovorax sp.]
MPEVFEPAWGFGVTAQHPLLTFHRYQAPSAPDWCWEPNLLLEELDRRVKTGGGDVGGGCTSELTTLSQGGRVLTLSCPLALPTPNGCEDVYVGTMWGNRFNDAPADYDLYGIGWVRRSCSVSVGDFAPSLKVRNAALRSSKAFTDFLNECRH